MSKKEGENTMICPECQREIPAGLKLCEWCGTEIPHTIMPSVDEEWIPPKKDVNRMPNSMLSHPYNTLNEQREAIGLSKITKEQGQMLYTQPEIGDMVYPMAYYHGISKPLEMVYTDMIQIIGKQLQATQSITISPLPCFTLLTKTPIELIMDKAKEEPSYAVRCLD